MKRIALLNLLIAGICVVSCTMKSTVLPESKGKSGEVLVVIDRSLWEGACGDSIRHYFAYPVEALTQAEPMFTLLQQQDPLSDFMKQFRSMLVIRIDAKNETAVLTSQTDVYAKNQLIFNLDAPSAESAIATLEKSRNAIISRFLNKDRDSYIAYYERITDADIAQKLRDKFQVDINIPREYSLDVDTDNFVWMAREEGERQMGVLMWKEPYTSQNQLDSAYIIKKMNNMLQKNIPGGTPGSYMANESLVSPVVKKFNKGNDYCVQLNGLWQMENGFMGGPYVLLTMVDTGRNQVVTAMGFVYFPRKDKRDYIRQLEAILYTMKPAVGG